MLSFEIEEENLDRLIEQKIEYKVETNKEEDEKIYPLFRNYPNGTEDYYLKLKSIDFKSWKNELRILFIDKTIFGDKYYNLLKNLSFKVLRHNKNDKKDYNLVISNNANSASELMTDQPIIYLNCSPGRFVDKKNNLFYYDNLKEYKKYQYYFYSNEIKCIYRKNTVDFIDAISKIKDME